MAEGTLASCARYIMIVLNLIFWIAGVVFLAIGIWVIVSDAAAQTITDKLHLSVAMETLEGIGYAFIGIGAFMFLIGFCGCCGAIRESAIMIGVYIIFMVVLLCGELAGIVYVALEKTTIEATIRSQLMSDVQNYTASNNMSNLDFLQAKFECCGVDNFTDYRFKSYYFKLDERYANSFVPDSCCLTDDHRTPAVPIDRLACQSEAKFQILNGTNLYTNGCFKIIKELIEDNSEILIGITAGIVVLELLGIVFAVFLCRNRTDYDYYDE
ncbi:Tetraspanin-17 [Mactra antiquata]